MDFSTSPFVVEQPIFMTGPPDSKEDLRLHPITPYREEWLQKLQSISPDAAQKVSQCGVVGDIYLVVTPDNQPRIEGGLCGREFDCPLCAHVVSYNRNHHAFHAVRNTTFLYELPRENFLHAVFTVDNNHGTTRDRVELLNSAIDTLVVQPWFLKAVLGYAMCADFAGSLSHYGKPLHAHWHCLILINNGVVYEDFKERVFQHMKSVLDDLIKWDSDRDSGAISEDEANWDKWMEPIYKLTPVDDDSSHWAESREVFSCHLKRDKRNPHGEKPAFDNFFERSEEDLREILPLFHDGLLDGKFGGILLDQGISLFEDGNYQRSLPPQYKAASAETRRVFRILVRLVQDAASIEKLKQLVEVPWGIPVRNWEELVMHYAKERGVIGDSEPQQSALQP